jgi:hypothetical protein
MNQVLDELKQEVTDTVGVMESAKVFIDGSNARMQTAVDSALANGATAEQLAPVTDEIAAMKAERDALAASIAANSPAAPATT